MAADVSIIVETNAKEVGNEFTGMAGQILATKAKAERLASAFKFLDKAMNSGKIDAQQYSKATSQLDKVQDQLYASIGKTSAAVKSQSVAMNQASAATARTSNTMSQAAINAQKMAAAQRMAGKSTNKFGLVSQQVGYQVGDFFVQVQSGTDALVAFGQQGTQLAGLLPGLAGAILGIGLSLGTAMLNASLTAKGLRVDFKAVFADFKASAEPILPLLNAIGSAFSYIGQVATNVFQSIVDNLDRVVAYTIAFAGLLTGKLVYGFIASGVAAKAFFTILKQGLISTGIGALVVGIGEIILALTKLVAAAGGIGKAFSLLWEVAKEAFGNINQIIGIIPLAIGAASDQMKFLFTDALRDMLFKFQDFTNKVVEGLNTTFNMKLPYLKLPVGINSPIDKAVITSELAAQGSANVLKAATSNLMTSSPKLQELLDLLGGGSGKGAIDTSDWLVPDTDDKDGKKDSMKTFMELLDKLKGETANQEKLLGVYGEKREVLEQVISFEDELKRKLTETEVLKLEQAAREKYRIEERGQLLETMTSNIKSAFMSVVDGSKSVVDAFRSMLRNIILAVYEQKVAQPAANAIGSLIDKGIAAIFSANGNVFNQGMHVKAYADGGVVNAPTGFRHSGGLGVMGEAGPEAIMPLKRGKNGKLGVQMEGSGGDVVINQSFNFSANGDESVKRIIRGEVPRITEATKAAVLDAKRRGGSYGRAF